MVEFSSILIVAAAGGLLWFYSSFRRSAEKSKKIRELSQSLGVRGYPNDVTTLLLASSDMNAAKRELFDFVIKDRVLGKYCGTAARQKLS